MKNSPKVATYDLQPEMSAFELAEALVPELEKEEVDFVCLNFANGDMVGHTGDFEAAKIAVNAVDTELGKIMQKAKEKDYKLMLRFVGFSRKFLPHPTGAPEHQSCDQWNRNRGDDIGV